MKNNTKPLAFTRLVRNYLSSLEANEQARTALAVSHRLGQPVDTIRELEYHAAKLQAEHQRTVSELVSRAVEMRSKGTA